MYNTKLLKQESEKPLQNLSKTKETQSTISKSPFVPRNKIDDIVTIITSLQKKLSNNKAILTQRKLQKSKFDINRFHLTLEQTKVKIDIMLKYSEKASIPPKLREVKPSEEE